MKNFKYPEESADEESVEEYIAQRIADINEQRGFRYAQQNPDFPAKEKAKNMAAINELCSEVESILPDVEKLIREIYPHIKYITEETKTAAAYLLIGRAYCNLQTALLACRSGMHIQAMELSRSGEEALALATLFWEAQNTASLEKWFKGKVIKNAIARKFHHKLINEGLSEKFENKELPIKEMLAKTYKNKSSYTHSGYAALLDGIDVFRLDFDFEMQAGYHYCVNSFHVVEELLIKVLLNLKNSFLHLNDHNNFKEADRLYKLFARELSKEQLAKTLAKYRKPSDGS